jgi:multiple sugar transport system permease protein
LNSISRLNSNRAITVERIKAKYFTRTALALTLWKIIRGIILFGLCFVILYPFGVKIIDSFKSFEDYLDPTVKYIPKYFTTNNIKAVFNQMQYTKSFIATMGFSTLIGLIQVGICGIVGYGFARFKFRGNKFLFFLVILALIIPPQTIVVPLFVKFRFFYGGLNLIGSYWPMIVLASTGLGIKNGLYIFMFRQFFINMPKELEEASYIDGCNIFQTFYRVMLPSATTLMVTVFLLSFSWQWTDTTYSNLFMRGTSLMANAIANVDGGLEEIMVTNYNNTAAVISVLPIALVYIFGQRFIIQGVERSGITG